MLKIIYYGLLTLVSVIGFFLFLAKLVDMKDHFSFHQLVFYILSLAAGSGLLYLAYQWGHQQNNWVAGIGAVVLALVAVAAIVLIGLFTCKGNIHWQ